MVTVRTERTACLMPAVMRLVASGGSEQTFEAGTMMLTAVADLFTATCAPDRPSVPRSARAAASAPFARWAAGTLMAAGTCGRTDDTCFDFAWCGFPEPEPAAPCRAP